MEESHSEDLLTIVGLMRQHFTHRIPQMSSKLKHMSISHTYIQSIHSYSWCMCTSIDHSRGVLTHDASFNLYEDILLLAGREAGTERWLLFTEPAPTLKEAQLDFLRFLLHGEGRTKGVGGV